LSAAAHLETTVAVRGLRPLAADPPHATNELLAAAARRRLLPVAGPGGC
jgi:hypothetical protein